MDFPCAVDSGCTLYCRNNSKYQ